MNFLGFRKEGAAWSILFYSILKNVLFLGIRKYEIWCFVQSSDKKITNKGMSQKNFIWWRHDFADFNVPDDRLVDSRTGCLRSWVA